MASVLLPSIPTLAIGIVAVGVMVMGVILWLSGGKPPASLPQQTQDLKEIEEYGQRVKHDLEEKSKRIDVLRGYLTNHYENDILPPIGSWLNESPQANPFVTEARVVYDVLGLAYVAYNPPSQIFKKQLEFQEVAYCEEIESHLGAEDWSKWENLRNLTNGQLDKVIEILNEIETDIRDKAGGLGLEEWNGAFYRGDPAKYGPPKNYFWMHRLVYQIWYGGDWGSEQVTKQYDSFYKADCWNYAGGAAQSQTKEGLDKLTQWLPTEAAKIATEREALPNLSPVQSALVEFRKMQGGIQYDYQTRHSDKAGVGIASLANSCSVCEQWIDEIKSESIPEAKARTPVGANQARKKSQQIKRSNAP